MLYNEMNCYFYASPVSFPRLIFRHFASSSLTDYILRLQQTS